jgi:hypothetical protein
MKKTMTIALILALLVTLGASSASAGKKKKKPKRVEHVEEVAYSSPGIGLSSQGTEETHCVADSSLGCVDVPFEPSDKFVSVEVSDAATPAVAGYVYQYRGDTLVTHDHFCTATAYPVAILTDADRVGVFIETGPCEDLTPATATQGTVIATLSNLP